MTNRNQRSTLGLCRVIIELEYSIIKIKNKNMLISTPKYPWAFMPNVKFADYIIA